MVPGCAQLAQGSPVPLAACPSALWAPLPSQDHLIRPQSPPFTQGLACVPLSRWTAFPALKPPLAAPTAGGRGLGLGTCRSSVCLRSIPWTWVTTSPQCVGRIPRVLPGGPSLAGRAGASRAEPRLVAGPGGEARTHALPGWMELEGAGQGPAQQGAPCALHSGLCGQETLTRRKVPLC